MGYGYDERLPSKPPFMWVEHHRRLGHLGVLAFGAYNAFGLIGPEKGGVAIVDEEQKGVVATKDFPYDPQARAKELERLMGSETTDELLNRARSAGYLFRSAIAEVV